MRTSCIKHPENESLAIVRQWQREYTNGNIVAAALLSFFEYWHNIKLEILNEKIREGIQLKNPYTATLKDLLQFHRQQELEQGIQGIGKKDSIIAAKKLLISLGAITEHKNPSERYAFDNTVYYQFHPEVVNLWLSENRLPLSENRQRLSENRQPLSENRQTITEYTSDTSFLENKGDNSDFLQKSENFDFLQEKSKGICNIPEIENLQSGIKEEKVCAEKEEIGTTYSSVQFAPKTQQDGNIKPMVKYLNEFLQAIEFLNESTGRNFQINENDRKGKTDKFKLFSKIMAAGYSIEDVKLVIAEKCNEWLNDSQMIKFLQPATIFSMRNFEKYIESIKAGQATKKVAENSQQASQKTPLQQQIEALGYSCTIESVKMLLNEIKAITPKQHQSAESVQSLALRLLQSEHAKKQKSINLVVLNFKTIVNQIKAK